MGYRTIVVGTDGSVTANAAQRAAVTMAKRTKARVVLVCGWDPALPASAEGAPPPVR